MVALIGMLVTGILILISGLIPAGWSMICVLGSYGVGLIFVFVAFAMFFYKETNKTYALIALGLYVFYVFFWVSAYHLVHGYSEVKNKLKEQGVSYRFVGVKKSNQFISYDSCHYVYDVQLADGEHIVFQAAYCEGKGWIPVPEVVTNYPSYYVPHYVTKYNSEHGTSLRAEVWEENEDGNTFTIYYRNDNCTEAENLIQYLRSETGKIGYRLRVYNEDTEYQDFYGTWSTIPVDLMCGDY